MSTIFQSLKRVLGAWWKPRHPWRVFFGSLLGSAIAIVILACISLPYAVGVVLSFFRGEVALFYWMGGHVPVQFLGFNFEVSGVGIHRAWATLIVIAITSWSITQQVWCGDRLKGYIKKRIEKLLTKHAPELNRFLKIGVRSKWSGSTPALLPESRFQKFAKKFPYWVLPLYCFDPVFGVASGVIFATSAKLKTWKALLILLAANAAEKILWGYFAEVMRSLAYHVVLPIVFILLGGIVVAHIVRFLYENNNRGAGGAVP